MSPFWSSLFEALRGRGRNGTLFVAVVLPIIGALLFTARLPRDIYLNYVLPTCAGILLLMVPLFIRNWLRERARGKDKVVQGSLSRDELNKARSKLVKGQIRKLS